MTPPRVDAGNRDEPAVERVLISACLTGRQVRFDGRGKALPGLHGDGRTHTAGAIVSGWHAEGRIVAYCPEVGGGLPVPRPPAEIEAGAAARDVLRGTARIRTPTGVDVTEQYLAGAHAALATARSVEVRLAVLKESSPSCGLRQVYDGTFSGAVVSGTGVTGQLLVDHGITVFSENEVHQAEAWLRELDAAH